MPKYKTPLDTRFQALADPTRRAVLAHLADGPASVGALATPFGMALPSFMQHLRVLEDGGLIVTEKTGRTRICRINPAAMGDAEAWMAGQRMKWEAQTDGLQAFVEAGRDLDDGPMMKEPHDVRPRPDPDAPHGGFARTRLPLLDRTCADPAVDRAEAGHDQGRDH